MKLYLDMCCYNRPYDDQTQQKISLETDAKLHIQTLIKDGKAELVGSYMLDYECAQNPYISQRNTIFDFMNEHVAAYVGIERKSIVEESASDIMESGIKFKDACHVASAIFAGCDYFISTDARLLNYKTDKIKLVSPIEYVVETEDK